MNTRFVSLPHLFGRALFTALVIALGVGGCGDGGGDGSAVVLRVNGGTEAREGIETMADGFSVRFDHAVLELEQLHLRTTRGADAMLENDPVLVDMVPSPVVASRFEGVDAQRWDEVGFVSAPPPSTVRVDATVDPEIADVMIERGWSHYVTGALIGPDGAEYPFAIGFPVTARYYACRSGIDRTLGVVVPTNGQVEAEVTWHLTHLFFDSFAEDASLRAEAIAAVYDGVDPISTDDLAAQDLTNLRGLDGELLVDEVGNPVLYIPPPGGAETLRDHVLAARFGHFNGLEGFCTTEVIVEPSG